MYLPMAKLEKGLVMSTPAPGEMPPGNISAPIAVSASFAAIPAATPAEAKRRQRAVPEK
jgi:hypothetical protein